MENTNLRKHLLTAGDSNAKPSETDSNRFEDIISKKNEAFLELRDSFDEVIAQKDGVIDSLRQSINKYRAENLTPTQRDAYEEALAAEKVTVLHITFITYWLLALNFFAYKLDEI